MGEIDVVSRGLFVEQEPNTAADELQEPNQP